MDLLPFCVQGVSLGQTITAWMVSALRYLWNCGICCNKTKGSRNVKFVRNPGMTQIKESRSVQFVRDPGMTEIKLFINGIKDPNHFQKSRQTL